MSKLMMKNGKVVRLKTLPVTNCEGCGKCCAHMGTPGGYASYFGNLVRGQPIPEWFSDSDDGERCESMPEAAKAELMEYYRAVFAGAIDDRTRNYVDGAAVLAAVEAGRLDLAQKEIAKFAEKTAIPCLWLDLETLRCRHYAWRPDVCRDAISPGDDACLRTRKAFRVPLPIA